MKAAQVIPFEFESHEIRTLLINDQPWFYAVDVCASISLSDTNKALIGLDEDEKCEHEQYSGSGRKPILINESGLYSLILRSRKPEAKRFKKWVTAEVLPSIRKHGHYNDDQGKMDTLLGQTIGANGFNILGGIIKGKVAPLEYSVRRSATAKLWSQVHAAFGVRSAEDIPADQFDSARQFIASYAIEGEYLPAANDTASDKSAQTVATVRVFSRAACHRWRELNNLVDQNEQLLNKQKQLMAQQEQLLAEQQELHRKMAKVRVDLYDPIYETAHRLPRLACGTELDQDRLNSFIEMQNRSLSH